MEVHPHHTLAALESLYRAESDALRARNLRIVILAKQGWPAPDIGRALGLSRRVVQDWVYAYNKRGLPGLEDERGAPPKPLLTAALLVVRKRMSSSAYSCSISSHDWVCQVFP
jgi:hypothetical protein